jgi:hypothetical protein
MLKSSTYVLAIVSAALVACGKSPSEPSPGGQNSRPSQAAEGAGSSADNTTGTAAQAATLPSVLLGPGEAIRILTASKMLPSMIDRAAFDVKARAAALGSDPQASFRFVRDQITTEPYPGVLRGATGTLSARSGNDLDKALLLGRLLEEGGHTVRYAYCELDTDRARNLVKSYFGDSRSSKSVDEFNVAPPLERALEAQGIPRARSAEITSGRARARASLDASIASTADSDLKLVKERLASAGIKPAPIDGTPALLGEARNHYWLQLKAGSDWQDLDASVRGTAAAEPLCRASKTFEKLPADLYQAITVSVRNEYLKNGALTAMMALTKRILVSDHYGDVLFFSNEVSGQSELLTAAPKRLTPALTLGTSVTRGEEYEYDAAAAGGGGFDPFGSALSGGEDEPPKLVAQWLDFTIEAPGRKTLVSRAIVDTVPPGERAKGKITTVPVPDLLLLSLLPGHAIAITAGPAHSGAVIESTYGSLDIEAATRTLDALDKGAKAQDEDVLALATHMLGAYALQFGFASERTLAKAAVSAGPHLMMVRDQPMITIAGFALTLNAKGQAQLRVSTDLRHDMVRIAADGTGYAEQAFWENVRHGLVDGAIERHLPFTSHPSGTASVSRDYFDTSSAMNAAAAGGVAIRAASGADALKLLQGDLAAADGERLVAEVGDGIAMIAPIRPLPATPEPRFGVWTVDLTTGHLNSLVNNGLRAVIVDYTLRAKALAILQVAIAACLRVSGRDCTGLIDQWTRIAQELIIQLAEHGV